MAGHGRHWCCTHNNPQPGTQEEYYQELEYDYMIIGHEVGASGTPHLQIYVCFKKKLRLAAILKIVAGGHWSICKGTPAQNRTYCMKEGLYEEYGTLPQTGGQIESDRWKQIHDLAKSGNVAEFYESHPQPAFLHPEKFKDLVRHYRPKPVSLDKINALWYLGPAGTGKSKDARAEFPDHYLKPSTTKWWPDYNNEDVVIIDDLSKTAGYMLEYLKNWADHYPFNAESKGGHTGLIRPKTIIVTTQYHWDDMTEDSELRAAIARRFTIKRFAHPDVDVDFATQLLSFEEPNYSLEDYW